MSDTKRVEVQVPGPGDTPGRIVVDGHDVSGAVHGVTIDAYARGDRVPVVSLDLAVREVDSTVDARIIVPPKVHEALLALGWTPPAS